MKLTRYGDLEWETRASSSSVGAPDGPPDRPRRATERKVLARGEPQQPGYFEMSVSRYPEAKDYKRHRHVIDQVRLTLAGRSPWAPDRATDVGGILYVPAGTYYGPYTRPAGVELLALQFAAGQGAPFEDGPVDAGDAPSRFTTPIELYPSAFPWAESGPGSRFRGLASFGTDGTSLSMISVTDGATYALAPQQRMLLFVTSGTGLVEGQRVSGRDAVVMLPGESAEIISDDGVEILCIGLPAC